RSHTILGTVSYMPPEQIHDAKRAGPPADTFSLGAVLYECVTGEPAYQASNPLQLIRQVLEKDVAPLCSKRQDCPAWLGATIDRALQRDPKKRFHDGAELAEALAKEPPPARA